MHLTLVYSINLNDRQVVTIINVPAPPEEDVGPMGEERWFKRTHPVLHAPVSDDLFVGWVFAEHSFEGARVDRVVIPCEVVSE